MTAFLKKKKRHDKLLSLSSLCNRLQATNPFLLTGNFTFRWHTYKFLTFLEGLLMKLIHQVYIVKHIIKIVHVTV